MKYELCFILARGRAYKWYDLVLILLAVVIVYPDKCLEWFEYRGAPPAKTWHILLLSVCGIGITVFFNRWLMEHYLKVDWWYPLMYIGGALVFRAVFYTVAGIFGWDRWE